MKDAPRLSAEPPAANASIEASLTRSGEPRWALAEVTSLAQDQNWEGVSLLKLSWTGDGADASRSMSHLRTLMGQLPGGQARVECGLTCEFEDGGFLETEYSGEYTRYQTMAGGLESQASQAKRAIARIGLELPFPDGLPVTAPELADLRDVFELVSLGHTEVTIERHTGDS